MGGSLIIAEKPSQARNLREALGNRYGKVLSARGHIFRLAEPAEVNAAWKKWSYDLLRPNSDFYPLRPDNSHGKGKLIAEIEAALKEADRVIIATDCDREGQAIGENILRYFKFKGEVLRAMFSAEDPVSLRQSFEALKPNEHYRPLYAAAVARAK
jgi:DNA topoisomerase-3